MTAARTDEEDIQALAKGGRTNVFGFLLRLAARIPFLFIAGRLYGPEALGRFAYAILIIEFAAQLASLGLRRGLAELLAKDDRPHAHMIADALFAAMAASAVGAAFLIMLPELMFPNSGINGLDRFLPLAIFAIVGTDIALSALAYKFDIASTVRARAIVEPWAISIAAGALYFYSARDGLILSYVASLAAALLFALWPLWSSYGFARGWRPSVKRSLVIAQRNLPLAAADAAEWGSRRMDLAILGLFASPAVVGIYYVAQQVASLPQKLKTSILREDLRRERTEHACSQRDQQKSAMRCAHCHAPNSMATSAAFTTLSPLMSPTPALPQFPSNIARSAAFTNPSLLRSAGLPAGAAGP